GDHAADVALAVGVPVFRTFLGDDVGHQVRGSCADAWQDTDAQADQAGATGVGQLPGELPEREAEAVGVLHTHRPGLALYGMAAGFGELDDLGHGKHADHYREHREAAIELTDAEGEAAHCLDRGDTYGGHGDAQGSGEQALDHGTG